MGMSSGNEAESPDNRHFVGMLPARGATVDYLRALHRSGRLRLAAFGTRRGAEGIPMEMTRLLPAFGGLAYVGAKIFSGQRGESFRYSMHPWFDRWAQKQMLPGEHAVSSYGYANACFQFSRSTGGKTFLDAGNSHPENFWNILSEEHERWGCPLHPISKQQYRRSIEMMQHVDYVLAPSSFVAESFLARGFKADQVLPSFYPVDLSLFTPAAEPRPKNRPLTLISTAGPSLRKGSPYMLEAFRIVHRKHRSLQILLTSLVHDSMREIVKQYSDLPIRWSPPLTHDLLAKRLQGADIFVLPSLEEGLVRSALEAMACGVPVVLTPNTGANDYIRSEEAGEVVPIRNAEAIAAAILKITERLMNSPQPPCRHFDPWLLSFSRFEDNLLGHLRNIGI
jgi:glycosyltransferase involved in cell wall biosynthesis